MKQRERDLKFERDRKREKYEISRIEEKEVVRERLEKVRETYKRKLQR